MRLLFALILLALTGCYTKHAAIRKFCKQDTATTMITVHDTVVVDSIVVDTIFSTTVDSVVVERDKLIIKYIRTGDSIQLSGKYSGDTIYKESVIEVKVPCDCPDMPKPAWYQKYIDATLYALSFLGVVFIIVIAFRFK